MAGVVHGGVDLHQVVPQLHQARVRLAQPRLRQGLHEGGKVIHLARVRTGGIILLFQ